MNLRRSLFSTQCHRLLSTHVLIITLLVAGFFMVSTGIAKAANTCSCSGACCTAYGNYMVKKCSCTASDWSGCNQNCSYSTGSSAGTTVCTDQYTAPACGVSQVDCTDINGTETGPAEINSRSCATGTPAPTPVGQTGGWGACGTCSDSNCGPNAVGPNNHPMSQCMPNPQGVCTWNPASCGGTGALPSNQVGAVVYCQDQGKPAYYMPGVKVNLYENVVNKTHDQITDAAGSTMFTNLDVAAGSYNSSVYSLKTSTLKLPTGQLYSSLTGPDAVNCAQPTAAQYFLPFLGNPNPNQPFCGTAGSPTNGPSSFYAGFRIPSWAEGAHSLVFKFTNCGDKVVYSCNSSCTTAAQCLTTMPNSTCFIPTGSTSGYCRLASNPTSISCSAPTPTPSATPTPTATPTPSPVSSPSPSVSPTPQVLACYGANCTVVGGAAKAGAQYSCQEAAVPTSVLGGRTVRYDGTCQHTLSDGTVVNVTLSPQTTGSNVFAPITMGVGTYSCGFRFCIQNADKTESCSAWPN